jgi:hypothetical protein
MGPVRIGEDLIDTAAETKEGEEMDKSDWRNSSSRTSGEVSRDDTISRRKAHDSETSSSAQ